ncbi:MAG: hypothetical protein HQL06_17000 [Nitrospirae bacterium]|nr:hypothetical protein [Nitrospirota bacterium]
MTLITAGVSFGDPIDDPVIKARERNQQRRINQGIRSGELTPQEAARLEGREAKIKQDEQRMKSDGKLTRAERRKLNKELNRSSHAIYKKKLNNRRVQTQ